ncbi:hypothetical protein D8674_026809 [Pyrus ussuriensis x Pyrus communis]|uniref:Uncharacterized protein n=1 Tax=Pyrus ussuriensis x Pyrus communis TaxID=2448454 RepID=A0A5N5H4S9_9ROSA|nr:hypothetical protein D8674_024740 [Pyrus ussuriensis x Pyrus communis]KAB2636275.1 hypothetical protein D8674_026809 [Pyrus ussuriensis x Pyrus communis]
MAKVFESKLDCEHDLNEDQGQPENHTIFLLKFLSLEQQHHQHISIFQDVRNLFLAMFAEVYHNMQIKAHHSGESPVLDGEVHIILMHLFQLSKFG